MKIKRLEIQGFKSFADRTILHFGDGITGVLGPNGCGKSNIVDAIRWAMGEQSAKHLRGGAMDDVIFAGSESRGPMGLAQVTITFKNDGNLVPPEYQHLSEISVTRRLFRDGTSEYLINKQMSLLRNIHELFMGTGIGKNSYAIIEQGRIGLVVTAKAEDRRALIEDAAGISKYKARRKAAERKLDAAEQNLLRVSDIVSELKKRLGTLERQAKKAEKYKQLKGELKELDLCAAVHRHLELLALERFEAVAVHDTRSDLDAQEAEIANDESGILEAIEALEAKEKDLREKETALRDMQKALAVGAKNVEHWARELDGMKSRRTDAEKERDMLKTQLTEATSERDELIKTADELTTSTGEEAVRLDEEQDKLSELESSIADIERQLERDKAVLSDCATLIAQHESNEQNLLRAIGDIDSRVERFDNDAKELAQQAKRAESDANEAKKKLADNRQLKLALVDRKHAQEGMLERYQAEFVQNEAQLLGLREELMDKRSRLMSLEEIQRNYEGCQAGVRAVMRRRESDIGVQEDLHGLVADVLSAAPQYEAAVEAVLGDRLQYIIVGSQQDGVASIDYLKTSEVGRSSFIPLDLREDHVSWAPRPSTRPPHESSSISDRPPPQEIVEAAAKAQAELLKQAQQDAVPANATSLPVPDPVWEDEDLWPDLDADGVCGKMVELVEAQDGYEHVARVLVGDVVVVEDMQTAQQLWRSNGHRKTLVTLSGEVLDPVGVLTGGSSEGVSAGMLAKKREIKGLADEVHRLEAQFRLAEERHKTVKMQITEIEAQIQSLGQEGHKEDLSILELEKDVRALQEEAVRHDQQKTNLTGELSRLTGERDGLRGELEGSQSALVDLKSRHEASQEAVAQRTGELNAKKVLANDMSQMVTELKVTVAATTEKRESSRRSLERLDARISEIKTRVEKLVSNIDESGDEGERLAETIEKAIKEGEDLDRDIQDRSEELAVLTDAYEQETAETRELDTEVRKRRKALDDLKASLSDATLRLREHQINRDALHEQIFDRYQIPLAEVVTDYHLQPRQSDEAAELRSSLRRKIDRMGEINLTAIREFEEVNERYSFLDGQQTDLVDAISQLKEAIKKIDATSKDRFLEAFELVNAKFEMVFPRLFNGGGATLVITDPENPLESGIEMLAQPPGKKLQSVNLLSGGEKALTAISLIFSIFLIKPTPFCLLDEVDAPLDDANVGRYNEMVRDMAQLSQFILITHNKRTMEIPDRLYGVTMEEPGISKLVGVDIKGAEDPLTAESA